ncbi:MAG: hypothetical protein WDN27_06835 [Candidatus Saccharibacteria bacterium]
MIPVEFLNYDAQARLYQRLFKIVGNELSYRKMFRSILGTEFCE